MTLPFGTRVTSCPNGKTTLHGVTVGTTINLDGSASYAVAWTHKPLGARPTWHPASELTPIPDPLALRVVRDLNPNGQDVVWGYVAADGRVTGIPHPHRIVPRVRDDAASAYIVGPDPALLIPEKT